MQRFVVEYSDILPMDQKQPTYIIETTHTVGPKQHERNRVWDRIQSHDAGYSYFPNNENQDRASEHESKEITKNISMAVCLALSWKLLMYALETLLVASERTPENDLLQRDRCDWILVAYQLKSVFHFV